MFEKLLELIDNWLQRERPAPEPVPIPVSDTGDRGGSPADATRISTLLTVLLLWGFQPGIGASAPETYASEADAAAKTILFLGDSLTAGYGIDEEQAYPALIQQKLEANGLNWSVRNAGLSGETTSGGLRRIDWLLRSQVDILVLALGANDGLRGVDLQLTRRNLQEIIDKTRSRNPDVKIVIAGMQVPPNLGTEYTESFRDMFPEIARNNNAVLIPFLLEDVAGVPDLNLPDGIHPTPEGHKIMAETVWTHLHPLL